MSNNIDIKIVHITPELQRQFIACACQFVLGFTCSYRLSHDIDEGHSLPYEYLNAAIKKEHVWSYDIK